MAEVETQDTPNTLYANFWAFKVDRAWRTLGSTEKTDARAEFARILEHHTSEGIDVRGVYSMVGLRHDAELLIWIVARDVDAMQRLAVALNASALGAHLEVAHSFLGVALGTRYTSDHAPAFVKGIPPKRYLSVYPFIKSHEWYQLPFEERRQTMAEHGRLGREYPDILTNTVSSFGVADHEFVVAFESDDLPDMVRMVEHLRPAASRPYTKLDTPILLGVMKATLAALEDLG
jgi:peroxiredoxin